MAIDKNVLRMISQDINHSKQKDRFLMLGRQSVNLSLREALRCMYSARVISSTIGQIDLGKVDHPISSKQIFQLLGFEDVESCDISSRESPDHLIDLQEPVCLDLHERYDYIFDGGTLEHVFDVRQTFQNVMKMLKVGGCVMHMLPANNMSNVGFYQFSPTFFVDLYRANSFEIVALKVFERVDPTVFWYLDLNPDNIHIPRQLVTGMQMILCVARKLAPTAEMLNKPIQKLYQILNGDSSHNLALKNKFYIWGTKGNYQDNYSALVHDKETSKNFIGFIDSSPNNQGKTLDGFPIYSPDILNKKTPDLVFLASWAKDEILHTIYTLTQNDELVEKCIMANFNPIYFGR